MLLLHEVPEGDFDGAASDPDVVAASWAAWHAEVVFARAFATEAPDLDIEGHAPWRGKVSLRWVLIHMIGEYARHNGHTDRVVPQASIEFEVANAEAVTAAGAELQRAGFELVHQARTEPWGQTVAKRWPDFSRQTA